MTYKASKQEDRFYHHHPMVGTVKARPSYVQNACYCEFGLTITKTLLYPCDPKSCYSIEGCLYTFEYLFIKNSFTFI